MQDLTSFCNSQVFSAFEFVHEGVYVNPSQAHPDLVRAVLTSDGKARKLVLSTPAPDGPVRKDASMTNLNAVFVSVILVRDVRVLEAAPLYTGSKYLTKRITGDMFEVESDLKSGFMGAAFGIDAFCMQRSDQHEVFTMRMYDTEKDKGAVVSSPTLNLRI